MQKKLKMKSVKSYQFVKEYFEDPDKLLNAIKIYHQKKHKATEEETLYDLLKSTSH